MKRIYLVLFILMLTHFVSCTREQGGRNTYLGTYSCVKTCSYWQMWQPTTYDTSNVNVEVLKNPNYRNGVIVNGDTVLLDDNGTYSNEQGSSYGYSLSFRNDSIFISKRNGGLGGQNTCYTKGVKQ